MNKPKVYADILNIFSVLFFNNTQGPQEDRNFWTPTFHLATWASDASHRDPECCQKPLQTFIKV